MSARASLLALGLGLALLGAPAGVGASPAADSHAAPGSSPGAGSTSPEASPEAIPLEAYAERLEAAIRALEAGEGEPAARWEAARAALGAAPAIRLPRGELLQAEALLDGAPPEDEPALQGARARLRLAADQIAAAAEDDSARRQAQLAAILAAPPFTAERSAWERLQAWLGERLGPLLLAGGESAGLGTLLRLLGWALAGLSAIAIALLFAHWWKGLRASLVDDAALASGAAAAPATALEARGRARAMAQAGSYREAIRQLCLAALLRLDEARLLHYDRGLTNREHLARLAPVPALRGHLEPMVDTFDSVWYGLQEPDAPTFERYLADLEGLEAALQAAALAARASREPPGQASGGPRPRAATEPAPDPSPRGSP